MAPCRTRSSMSLRNSRFAVRSCSTNSRLRTAERVSAKRRQTSPASNRSRSVTVSRVLLSFCSATSVRRARRPNSSSGISVPTLKRLSSPPTSLSSSTDSEGFARSRACASAPFAESIAWRSAASVGLFANARATSSVSLNPLWGSRKRLVDGEAVVCARSAAEQTSSANRTIEKE